MFSSCVSIDESRRPVACTTWFGPTSTEAELRHRHHLVRLDRDTGSAS